MMKSSHPNSSKKMTRTFIVAVAATLLITTAAQAEPAYHVIIENSIGCVTLNKEALQVSAGVRSGTVAELKPAHLES